MGSEMCIRDRASTPLSATLLAHFFTKNEKINLTKVIGVLIGFSGIVFLFSDNILINQDNFMSALLILIGSTFYVIGGLLTIRIRLGLESTKTYTGSISYRSHGELRVTRVVAVTARICTAVFLMRQLWRE